MPVGQLCFKTNYDYLKSEKRQNHRSSLNLPQSLAQSYPQPLAQSSPKSLVQSSPQSLEQSSPQSLESHSKG